MISKQMQSVDFDLSKALEIIELTIKFFLRYRDSGFEDVLLTANGISLEIDVEQTFPVSRRRKHKTFFDEAEIQEVTIHPQEKFRIDTFNSLIDIVLGSLEERFKQLNMETACYIYWGNSNYCLDDERIFQQRIGISPINNLF